MAKTAVQTGVRARSRKRKRPTWLIWTKKIAAFSFMVLLAVTASAGTYFFVLYKQAGEKLDSLPSLVDALATHPTVFLARDGQTVLFKATEEYREPILKFDEVPQVVVDATLAAEDKRFFEHKGVDIRGAFRSVFTNIKEGSSHGGSTITMQLAKRMYTSPKKDIRRKIEDVAIAMNIERILSKKEILRTYLNQVYYGHGAYGIKAAAKVYFNKNLDQLTVAEAAMLARSVRRPSYENPFEDLEAAVHNRDVVLNIMLEEKMITSEQHRKAKAEKPKLAPKRFGSGERMFGAPYFVRWIQKQLERDLPGLDLKAGGYTVYTTLDPEIQKIAEESVKKLVKNYKGRKVTTGAFVLMDAQGQVIAMVGGEDFDRNEYNVVTQGARQPGSSFKPFVYSAALSTGALKPGDTISNAPYHMKMADGKTWSPKNSNRRFSGGRVRISDALAYSYNVPAVWVMDAVTPSVAVSYARGPFGFRSKHIPAVMSLALGTCEVSPLEMAQGYSVFMLRGDRATPYGVTRVLGPDRSVVKAYAPNIQRNMLDSQVAELMDEYLRGVITKRGATGWRANVIENARGKTGTTQENKDAWFCGYTNNFVGIGWVANERYDKQRGWVYDPMSSTVYGGQVTIQMWIDVMKAVQKKYKESADRDAKALERDVEVVTEVRAPEPATDNVNPDNELFPPDGEGTSRQDGAVPPVLSEPPVTDPPREEKPPVRSDPPVERSPAAMVTVEICADTGQKATIYCPETVGREFRKGSEPKRWCRRHTP